MTKKLKLHRRPRHQRGSLWLRKDRAAWWIRFYQNGKQTARFLCNKDDVHHSKTCRAVQDLRDAFMRSQQPNETLGSDQRVVDFLGPNLPSLLAGPAPAVVRQGFAEVVARDAARPLRGAHAGDVQDARGIETADKSRTARSEPQLDCARSLAGLGDLHARDQPRDSRAQPVARGKNSGEDKGVAGHAALHVGGGRGLRFGAGRSPRRAADLFARVLSRA